MFTKQERLAHVNEVHGQLVIIGIFKSFGSDNRFHVICSCRPNRKIVMDWKDITKYGMCFQCQEKRVVSKLPDVYSEIQEELPGIKRKKKAKKEPKEIKIRNTPYTYNKDKAETYSRDFVIACLVQQYIAGADERGYSFGLSLEEFEYLITQPCHYCGIAPNKVKQYGGGELHHLGIDRVHNHIGYVFLNCVSCCWKCNQMKRAMQYSVFLETIRRIYNHSAKSLEY